MPSQFGQYQSGIEAATGNLVPASGQMAAQTANTIAGFGQSIGEGIKKYQANNAEAEMINEEAQGLGEQLKQFQSIFGNNPEYTPFAEQLGGYVNKLSKIPEMSLAQKRGALNGAKVAFSQIGTQLQMFTAMKTQNEQNAMYNAQGQAAGATTTVDDTVKTRASQFDPLKPYATQEVGFIDNLKKLQKQYPNAQIDVPSRLEEWRNNVSAQANELAKSNPLGLKVIDQVEAARKIDTATSPDVEGYNEAQQAVTNPAYTPTAEDLKALTVATGNQVTAQNITPELAAGVQKANSIAEGLNFNANPVTREKTIVDLLKKTIGASLPALGSFGQALQTAYMPNRSTSGVSQEQVQQYRQPSVGDLVSTASKMGYPAYAALGLGANALMAGGSSVSAQAQPSTEQPAEQAQVQPTAQQPAMPAQRPANVPTIAVPEMKVGTAPREVPLNEVEKKQKTLEIFSKILKYGVDENGKQIIAPQAERMYQTMKPEQPKVYHLQDSDGNIVSGTMNAKGDFKQFTTTTKTASEKERRLTEASTFGVKDSKTGELKPEAIVEGAPFKISGVADVVSPKDAMELKSQLKDAVVGMQALDDLAEINKHWLMAKVSPELNAKAISAQKRLQLGIKQAMYAAGQYREFEAKGVEKVMPHPEEFFRVPWATNTLINELRKDLMQSLTVAGKLHKLNIEIPTKYKMYQLGGQDFQLTDARSELTGVPAK